MVHQPIRADEYRARAAAETAAGEASPLGHVKAKHERAAQVWADLAYAEDVRGAERAARQRTADQRTAEARIDAAAAAE